MSAKKVKICQVASVDLSLRFLLLPLLKYLKDEGFEVWAVSSQGPRIPEVESFGIKVKAITITRKLFTPFQDIVALIRLILLFRKERFDIVHTHTPKASFLGQLAAFITRVPVRIYTVHGFYFHENSTKRRRWLFTLIERILGKIVHLAFFVNREDMKLVIDEGIYTPEKIKYYGAGIDLQRFNPYNFSVEFISKKKSEVKIPQDTKVIGIVARLVKEKGFTLEGAKNKMKERPKAVKDNQEIITRLEAIKEELIKIKGQIG